MAAASCSGVAPALPVAWGSARASSSASTTAACPVAAAACSAVLPSSASTSTCMSPASSSATTAGSRPRAAAACSLPPPVCSEGTTPKATRKRALSMTPACPAWKWCHASPSLRGAAATCPAFASASPA
eukprot:scaffold44503_cov59-Phaeocystis_antarctica.AAC.2